ncbi:hypothetical protein JCM10207_008476 [Rhodosporidiobolus poonsookiae]
MRNCSLVDVPATLLVPPPRDFFTALPAELINLIYDFAFIDRAYRQVMPRGAPCKALLSVHLDHFYADICLRSFQQIRLFDETITCNPDIALKVKGRVFVEMPGEPEDELYDPDRLAYAELDTVFGKLTALKELGFMGAEVYCRWLLTHSRLVLPALERLEITPAFLFDEEPFEQQHYATLDRFISLRTLHLHPSDISVDTDFHGPASLTNLPGVVGRLRRLEIMGDFEIDEDGLELLAAATALQELSLQIWLHEPGRALEQVANPAQLEKLTLIEDDFEPEVDELEDYSGQLRRFTSLAFLTFFADTVPTSPAFYDALASLPLRQLTFNSGVRVSSSALVSYIRNPRRPPTLQLLILNTSPFKLEPDPTDAEIIDDLEADHELRKFAEKRGFVQSLSYPWYDSVDPDDVSSKAGVLSIVAAASEFGITVQGSAANKLEHEAEYEAQLKRVKKRVKALRKTLNGRRNLKARGVHEEA